MRAPRRSLAPRRPVSPACPFKRQALHSCSELGNPSMQTMRGPATAGRGRTAWSTRASATVPAKKGFGTPLPKPATKQAKQQPVVEQCPCASGKAYKNCCEPFHKGPDPAPTAEATLRARFSAYPKGKADYLVGTTHPDYHVYHYSVAQPGGAEQRLREDIASACNKFAFSGLKIVKVEPGSSEREAYVAFEYLSRKKLGDDGLPLPEAQLLAGTGQWDKTAEKGRFLQVEGGTWQFADYQRATFGGDMLAGAMASAESSAAASS